jgi:galactokinase
MPIAIDRRTWVAMSRAPANVSRAVSVQQAATGEFRLGVGRAQGGWWDYVHGAVRAVPGAARALPGVLVAVASDVPVGAGLSSSAALSVATAAAAQRLCYEDEQTSCGELAQWAHHAERDFVGMPCGVMDQVACACAQEGHAIRLWCDTMETAHLPFPRSLLIIDSAAPRALRRSEYTTRKAECDQAFETLRGHFPGVTSLGRASLDQVAAADLTGALLQRARHVVTEVSRVNEMAQRLRVDAPVGDLLLASHSSLRDDFDCSTPELNWIVERACEIPGVDGARLTGAGWGGCAIVLGSEAGLKAAAEVIREDFARRWGREPGVWRTIASGGSRLDRVGL